ncbi:MAG TPA: hypothetical protein VJ919_05095 [Tangfeifania sp.]|nr:hypothetical protein [Tangfeifania sp.]
MKLKNIFYLGGAIAALLLNACNPMEDINEEVEQILDERDKKALFLIDKKMAPEAYTLTEADYELSSNESVSNFHNFSSSALPKDYLPEILNQKFSGEHAQSMMVTYDFYNPPFVDKENAREVDDEEYASMGQSYPNFGDEDEAEALIAKLLDRTEYVEEAGVEMTVQYTLFATNETRYIRINADSTAEAVGYTSDAVEVTAEIYEATGNGRYMNFYRIDNALEDLRDYAVENELLPITYAADVYQNYLDEYAVYMYNGSNWELKESVMPVTEELNYFLDEDDITQSYWWADPAVKITLTSADYGIFPGTGDDGGTARYGNFDLRSGKIPGTDTAKLIEMIGEMLDTNHNAVEGQQYLVTYAYYDGSNGSGIIRIIKDGGIWKEYDAS